MLCSKCGFEVGANERFCRNCGNLIETQQVQNNQQFVGGQVNTINGQQNQNINQQQYNYSQKPTDNIQQTFGNNQNGGLNSNNVSSTVNPNMKKWAILSIVISVFGIVWYTFIGLSFYMAIIIASAGFAFAQKGEIGDKKLAKIGKITNGILVGCAIIMLVLNLIIIFTN